MQIFKRNIILLILAIVAINSAHAGTWIVAGAAATNNGSTIIAAADEDSRWNGFFSTNIHGVTALAAEVPGGTMPDPEFAATEIALRLTDNATSCREAILSLSDILQTAPVGDTYATIAIADAKEAWIIEYAGKSDYGALWAAVRLPDTATCVYSGKAMLHKLPQKDYRNCIYSPEISQYAKQVHKFAEKNVELDFAKCFAPAKYTEPDNNCELIYSNLYAPTPTERYWRIPNRHVSIYDIAKTLRNKHYSHAYYSFIADTNSAREDYMRSLIYYAPGSPKLSVFLPIFRNAQAIPNILDPQQNTPIYSLLDSIENGIKNRQIPMRELRSLQISLEDSISVDVKVALEQIPEFDDEEIAIELLKDLADIWAQKFAENYKTLIDKYCRNKETE